LSIEEDNRILYIGVKSLNL